MNRMNETVFKLHSIFTVVDGYAVINEVEIINKYGDKIYFNSIYDDITDIDSSAGLYRTGCIIDELRSVDDIDEYLIEIIIESNWQSQVKKYFDSKKFAA